MKTGCRQKSMHVSSVTGSMQAGLGGAMQSAHAQHPMTVVGVGETVAVAVRVGVLVCACAAVATATTVAHSSATSTAPPVRRLGYPEPSAPKQRRLTKHP
jgi:hypothetical protein